RGAGRSAASGAINAAGGFQGSVVETQHAAGLFKLAVPSQSSAALFAARLRIARSETPGWRILYSSPASFAGRLDLISDGKGNSAVRLEAGLDFQTTFTRGCTTGLFSTVPQKARHCSGMAPLNRTSLQHAASLPIPLILQVESCE